MRTRTLYADFAVVHVVSTPATCRATRSTACVSLHVAMSALYLLQTYCLPSLLYSCETWYLSSCGEKRVKVAWNNAFRKIFNAFWYESVKPLQYYCSCLPVTHEETVILEENVV